MANAPFAQFPGDFESLARQYWNTGIELLGRGGMPDAWGLAGAMPPGLGAMGMGTGTYDWYQRMQRLAADFSGGGSAADVAGAWREMMGGQAADPFAGMLRSMHGGLAGGDWLEQMRPLLDMLLKPLRQQGAEWLQRPAFGPAREHQERLQALALAWQQWEQSNEAFNAQLAQAGQAAFARFEQLLEQHDAPGKRLESARALFDLWIEAAEEAWAELAFTDEYRKAYGEMTNAMMRVRLGLQGEVERMSALLGMPGRTEVDALARKVAELERAQYQARRAASQAAAAGKATSAPATRKPVVAADAAAEARVAPAARAAAPARAATVAKPAKAAKVAKAGSRKVAGKPRKQPRPAEVRVAAAQATTGKAARKAAAKPVAAARKSASRPAAAAAPAAKAPARRAPAQVVSMKDWVNRNLPGIEPPVAPERRGKSGRK